MAKKTNNRQKRANQNRAQRAALSARTSGEGVKRPSRIAPSTAERLASEPRDTGRTSDKATDSGSESDKGARKPRERAPRLGDRPVDIDTLKGGFLRKVSQVPGGLQVIMTLGLAVIVTGLTGTQKLYKDPGKENVKDAPFTMTIFEKLGTPKAAALLAIPIVASLVALAFSLHKQRRRVWLGAAVAIFAAMLFNVVLLNYLVVGGFLIYAMWRSQRIEGPQEPLRRRRPTSSDEDDEVSAADDGDEDDEDPSPVD